jgi:putative protease
MLLYTRRRVLNELDAFKNKENMLSAEISEAKRNDEYFTVIDNNHGSFMLHSKHICLLEEIPLIIDAEVSSILIDLRGYEPHIISETAKIYNEAIEYYLNTGDNNLSDFKKRLPDTGKEFFKGFFLENNTDKISKKTVTYNLDKEQNKQNFIGEIIDFVKEKTVTIKLEKSISVGDKIAIDTPEGKLIELKIDFIKTLDGKYVNKTEQSGIYTINWKKGMVNRSYIYYKKADS